MFLRLVNDLLDDHGKLICSIQNLNCKLAIGHRLLECDHISQVVVLPLEIANCISTYLLILKNEIEFLQLCGRHYCELSGFAN